MGIIAHQVKPGLALWGGTSNELPTESNVDVMISRNGNVGIGDTTPSYKLDVAGDINFTGNLYQNGSAFSGGGGGAWTESNGNVSREGNVGIGNLTFMSYNTTPSYCYSKYIRFSYKLVIMEHGINGHLLKMAFIYNETNILLHIWV